MHADQLKTFHEKRPDFFIAMYNQLNAEITRHTAGVWEALGTILAAGGLLSLAEKAVLSLSFAVVLLSLVLTWFIAQTLEANYWYNRNLLIIANIERHFLREADLKNVHWYFDTHRKDNDLVTYLQISLFLGLALFASSFGWYCWKRFLLQPLPGNATERISATTPLVFGLIETVVLVLFWRRRVASMRRDDLNSPGLAVHPPPVQSPSVTPPASGAQAAGASKQQLDPSP